MQATFLPVAVGNSTPLISEVREGGPGWLVGLPGTVIAGRGRRVGGVEV